MRKPLLSVVIITYNHDSFIKDCLDGALMQKTDFPIEILVGEDESDDGTREICKDYAKKYPDKIKLFLRHRKDVIYINGRATGRYNFIETLKKARGKYIALCDGDDYWTDPLKLQKQVDFLEANQEYSIYHHAVKFTYLKDKSKKDTIWSVKLVHGTINDLAKNNFISCSSVVFRKQPFIHNLPDFYYNIPYGDYGLHLLNARSGDIYFISEILSTHRVGDGIFNSLSNSQRMINGMKMLNEFIHYFHRESFVNDFISQYIYYLSTYVKSPDYNSKILYPIFDRMPPDFKSKILFHYLAEHKTLIEKYKNQFHLFSKKEKLLEKKLINHEKERDKLRKDLAAIKKSYTFRMGRLISFPLKYLSFKRR